MKSAAILVAAGRGTRMGSPTPKAFLPLAGRPLFTYALRTLDALPSLESLILVVAAEWRAAAAAIVAAEPDLTAAIRVVDGGVERQDSVAAGLAGLDETDIIIIHDAARPFTPASLFTACIEAAIETGGAIAALPAKDTLKIATPTATIERTIDRSAVWSAQTPQAFRLDLLQRAYAEATRDGFVGTDDASLVERLGKPVRLVIGSEANRKLTTPDDLAWAEWYAGLRPA